MLITAVPADEIRRMYVEYAKNPENWLVFSPASFLMSINHLGIYSYEGGRKDPPDFGGLNESLSLKSLGELDTLLTSDEYSKYLAAKKNHEEKLKKEAARDKEKEIRRAEAAVKAHELAEFTRLKKKFEV